MWQKTKTKNKNEKKTKNKTTTTRTARDIIRLDHSSHISHIQIIDCRLRCTSNIFAARYDANLLSVTKRDPSDINSPTPHCRSPCTIAGATLPETTTASYTLPQKLVKRILELEYVDMADIVPDSWRFQEEEPNRCCHQQKRQRQGPVTDILSWVECYSSLIAVLATKYPTNTPEFMAYLKTIVHASKSFLGDGWVTYDSCYRSKAAVTKSLNWSQVDFTLYNETRAKIMPRCKFCNSELHHSADCSYAPDSPEKHNTSRSSTFNQNRFETTRSSNYVCHLYNHKLGNRCRFTPCRFIHQCLECKGAHPASQCRSRPPPRKITRSESPVGRRD